MTELTLQLADGGLELLEKVDPAAPLIPPSLAAVVVNYAPKPSPDRTCHLKSVPRRRPGSVSRATHPPKPAPRSCTAARGHSPIHDLRL